MHKRGMYKLQTSLYCEQWYSIRSLRHSSPTQVNITEAGEHRYCVRSLIPIAARSCPPGRWWSDHPSWAGCRRAQTAGNHFQPWWQNRRRTRQELGSYLQTKTQSSVTQLVGLSDKAKSYTSIIIIEYYDVIMYCRKTGILRRKTEKKEVGMCCLTGRQWELADIHKKFALENKL